MKVKYAKISGDSTKYIDGVLENVNDMLVFRSETNYEEKIVLRMIQQQITFCGKSDDHCIVVKGFVSNDKGDLTYTLGTYCFFPI